jgi:hypothetical protein
MLTELLDRHVEDVRMHRLFTGALGAVFSVCIAVVPS